MDSICEYKFADKAFYAVTGDKEKIVARVDGGRVVFEKGCAGPHKERLTAWIKEQGISFEEERSQERGERSLTTQGDVVAAQPRAEGSMDKMDTMDKNGQDGQRDGKPAAQEAQQETAQADEAFIVENIPAGELPEFDLMLGVATPGFEEFVKAHRIEGSARVALVKRLEKMARK